MRPTTPPGPPVGGESEARLAKQELRAELRARRRRRPETTDEERRRTEAALQISRGHRVVACYASLPEEPDTWALIDALHRQGVTVLLPVLGPKPDGSNRRDPDWAPFETRERLAPRFREILEPLGASLGSGALAAATLIWCSGLAATPHGERLGTGGGWFDRALTDASPAAVIGMLLREDEVLPHLPTESWDRRVDLIVTPSRVIEVSE